MLKYIVFRINQVNSFEKGCSVHAKSGFRNSACDITVSFHSSLSREEYRHSSVAFGSTLYWESDITVKYVLMLSQHGIECISMDKR